MVMLFEVNFASLFLEKLFLSSGNPAGIKFAASISMQSRRKLQQIQEGFKRSNCDISPLVISWTQIAQMHFEIMMYYSLYQTNTLMTQKIIEKTKDVETIYFENNLLAHKVLDLREALKNFANNFGANDMFNLKASALHSLAFINQAQEYNLKK
jgi:hypothetical protein